MEWLMSADVMGAFDEVYMNPQRCGYGTQSWLRNMDMKDNVNAGKTLIDGYSLSFVSGDRWYAMWFLMVREIWPCEVRSPKEWSRSP
jgi:hypothetical protein